MYLRQVGVVPILSCMENIELWCVGAAYATVFLCCLQDCREISLLVCKLGELNVYLLMYLIIAR